MISVIVPVFNVEKYLRKCLDSILNQTYRDLEILVVDDGSTDGSGIICDEYKSDKRIKVYHTKNRGLSAARNLGLDNATGDWIGFVDSDDWIESEMYEALIRRAEETGADVVECGCYTDFASLTLKCTAIERTVYQKEALDALIKNEIRTQVWNKIWSKRLFSEIRFPEGHYFEDVATTYKLVQNAKVSSIPEAYYHWQQRESSISQNHDSKNLEDYWIAHKQRYIDIKDFVSEETAESLLKLCAYAIARAWIWNFKSHCSSSYLNEMNQFARNFFPRLGFSNWPLKLRVIVYLTRFNNQASFTLAYILNQAYRLLKPKYYQ